MTKQITWAGYLLIRDKKVLMVMEHDTDFYKFPGFSLLDTT
jgi:hypothetical protein